MSEMDFLNAIDELTGRVGFRIEGMDLDTLVVNENVSNPTLKQIENKIKEIKLAAEAENNAKLAAKAAILDRLGLTEDEAKLLLS